MAVSQASTAAASMTTQPAKVLPLHRGRLVRAKRELTHGFESFDAIAVHLPPLFTQQWRELEDTAIPLAVNWNAFFGYAATGVLHVSVARSGGKIAGFIFGLTMPTLNHATTKYMLVERFYLLPEHRGGWFALRWFRDFIDHSRELGCKQLIITENIKFMAGRVGFFRRLGLDYSQVSFSMRL